MGNPGRTAVNGNGHPPGGGPSHESGPGISCASNTLTTSDSATEIQTSTKTSQSLEAFNQQLQMQFAGMLESDTVRLSKNDLTKEQVRIVQGLCRSFGLDYEEEYVDNGQGDSYDIIVSHNGEQEDEED